MQRNLKNWKARRSGDSITVSGEDVETGKQTKLTKIELIAPPSFASDQHVFAIAVDGTVHKLLFT